MSLWLGPFAARERTLYLTELCAETPDSELQWNRFTEVVILYWTSAGSPKLVYSDICQLSSLCCWKAPAMLTHINRGKTLFKVLNNHRIWVLTTFLLCIQLCACATTPRCGWPRQCLLRAGELTLQTRLGPTDNKLWVNVCYRSGISNLIFCERVSFLPPLYAKYFPMSSSLPVTIFSISSKSHLPYWIEWPGPCIGPEVKETLIRLLPSTN